jgi:hypothetical protein
VIHVVDVASDVHVQVHNPMIEATADDVDLLHMCDHSPVSNLARKVGVGLQADRRNHRSHHHIQSVIVPVVAAVAFAVLVAVPIVAVESVHC